MIQIPSLMYLYIYEMDFNLFLDVGIRQRHIDLIPDMIEVTAIKILKIYLLYLFNPVIVLLLPCDNEFSTMISLHLHILFEMLLICHCKLHFYTINYYKLKSIPRSSFEIDYSMLEGVVGKKMLVILLLIMCQ
jgi:hypothetical protein